MLFCGNQDEETTPILVEYKLFCPRRINEGAIKEDACAANQAITAKQSARSVAKVDTETTTEEGQSNKIKKKRRQRGSAKFKASQK